MHALEKNLYSEENLAFINSLHQFLFLKFQGVETLSCDKHFMIVFEELLPYFYRNNKDMFALFNELLKKRNIMKIYQQQDMGYAEKSLPFIKHYFLMKQEDPCCNFVNVILNRDLKMLHPGDFFYTKDLKNVNKNASLHKFMYMDFNKINNFYVNQF